MSGSDQPNYEQLGKNVEAYCKKYGIRIDDFFSILNDQKVIPMLRGKAAEYDAVAVLSSILNPQIWVVSKLNLNPQPGTNDQDIGVTHRRTGIQIVIETKSAVRGSMTTGVRARNHKQPHYKVKCHRSRSNTSLVYNDHYLATEFDVIVATPTNALFEGGTVGEEFELVSRDGLLDILYHHYNVADELALINATNKDWRFALPQNIAENIEGYQVIPRTPTVLLANDPNWLPIDQIHAYLEAIVQAKNRRSRS
jgi:hypothetical protein